MAHIHTHTLTHGLHATISGLLTRSGWVLSSRLRADASTMSAFRQKTMRNASLILLFGCVSAPTGGVLCVMDRYSARTPPFAIGSDSMMTLFGTQQSS
jgi:hypothetical protein